MKFTGTFVSMVSMLVMAGYVQAKAEAIAYSDNSCTGANSGTLDFGDAFCTSIGGPWDSIQFFTDSATECFNAFSSSDCSSGFIEVFEASGTGFCFTGLGGGVKSFQKFDC
ncbi:hypothetical protein BT96DRAFT_974861 [Gymnopus androsaceus JB14]|uniref:Uncharacterized protein n=1 Tax=Gymnopus androsaceus JB14 TaxID=1447944 RepID=A0A6A4HXN2_9AGAR|nr:hypothetical protein BT96DRAFT_974861 [Gymnopus androsaceus JB14]